MRFVDLKGEKFGRLLVIERVFSKDKNVKWLCKCDCGNKIEAFGVNLKNGHVKSCGCYKSEITSNRTKIGYGVHTKNRAYGNYESNARKRNISFDISFEQFLDLAKQNCYYCGSAPSNKYSSRANNGDFIYQGIDRKDNTKGYTVENCVSCCKICNRAKDTMTYQEFIEWINKVHKKVSDKE